MTLRERVAGWLGRRPQSVEAPPVPPQPYDVLVFPIVSWDYLFQRPQHLSLEFARRGHRVFYFSSDFIPDTFGDPAVREAAPNVFTAMLPGGVRPPDIYRDVPTELQAAAMESGVRRLRERF